MRLALIAPLVVLALAVGCARTPTAVDAPSTTTPADVAVRSRESSTPQRPMPADPAPTPPRPIKSTGLPPERVDAGAPRLDTGCRSDADCAVKNVGNCCGAMPACVNAKATPDPAAVKADCERRGVMSTCGFKAIQSCSCVAGTCRDAASDSNPVAQ